MRQRILLKDWKGALPIAVLLSVLLLCPVKGLAATAACTMPVAQICDSTRVGYSTTDCDKDGFTDKEECEGVTLPARSTTTTPTKLLGFTSAATLTGERLDPAVPDLFYYLIDSLAKDIAVTSTTSLIAQSAKAANSMGDATSVLVSGLKVRTHLISILDTKGTDRWLMWDATATPFETRDAKGVVTATNVRAKAAKIIEYIEASPSLTAALAITTQGTPSGLQTFGVSSKLYTSRIKANVVNNCVTIPKMPIPCSINGTNITNATATPGVYDNTPIINFFVKQVVAHELAHACNLAVLNTSTCLAGDLSCPATAISKSTATTGNYHYASADAILASQTVFGTLNNVGKYTIGTAFDPVLDTYGFRIK